MKLTSSALLVIAATVATSSAALADDCSLATLNGHYTYWAQGVDAAGKATAEVGQEHFDGAGNITTVASSAGSAEAAQDTGTYSINPDCSGTSTYASGASYAIYVAPSGDSFVFVNTNEGIVSAGENTRVAAK
jgi:hypothetical protein